MTFPWPPIDAEVQAAVIRQLHTDVSLYDRAGIIARFEDAFAARHSIGDTAPYALLTSSGTAALHSAYYALGVGPGDEVIVQDYTFFATATPLLQLGAVPVLADVDPHGEVDIERAAGLVTEATKALVVTHMWGNPQNTRRLRAWCEARGLALVEDCSHAHGAARDGVSVGELADVACWSLQGRKTITAGEGGVLTTPHCEVYEKATLLGHFNKRALAEVRRESPLYQFAETGLGLKYRAHPLGLAMAEVYLRRLDDWLTLRQRHAARLEHLLAGVPGIGVLTPTGPDRVGTFYAFVFTIDPLVAGFTRDGLLRALHQRGYGEITTCESMRPLHTYPIFVAPHSPVSTYRSTCIRSSLRVAERLAATSLRLQVPADDGPGGRNYIDTAIDALNEALAAVGATTLAPWPAPTASMFGACSMTPTATASPSSWSAPSSTPAAACSSCAARTTTCSCPASRNCPPAASSRTRTCSAGCAASSPKRSPGRGPCPRPRLRHVLRLRVRLWP